MAKTIDTFEDLVAWQMARELTREVYRTTSQQVFQRDFGLQNQLRRLAVSMMSKIGEGFVRGGRAKFHRFLVIATGSCAEFRSQLYVAVDAGYITREAFRALAEKGNQAGKMVIALRTAVKRQRDASRRTPSAPRWDRQPPPLRHVLRPTSEVPCALSAEPQRAAPPRVRAYPPADSPPPPTSTR
jgi:four helix bundle protein